MARRADVAKGTIYLHFADKETLFQELIRMELSPVVAALENVSHADIPFRAVTGQLIEVFAREIFETRRKDVIRLVITEGPRFPKLAEFYYREVISRVMETIRAMLRRAYERGELKTDALVRFPQLLAAPGIVAIIWSGLFDRFEPLDVRALMRAHFDVLLGSGGAAMTIRILIGIWHVPHPPRQRRDAVATATRSTERPATRDRLGASSPRGFPRDG